MKNLCLIFSLLFFPILSYAETRPFVSKRDHFSIVPPYFMAKPKIEQLRNENEVIFAMSDDFGDLFCVDHTLVDVMTKLFIANGLDGFLNYSIKKNFPNSSIIQSEFVILEDKSNAYFCLYDLPQGSILLNADTKEKYDTKRGCLVFAKNNRIIVLSYQTDMSFMGLSPLVNNENVYSRYLEELMKSAKTFKIVK